jgi:tRNA A-37 threonylcarbamoyl transferase component Bud32
LATHHQQLDRSRRRALPAPRGGTRWSLAPEIAPAIARWLADTGDDALADPATRAVKDGAHRTVYRVDLPDGAVYLKRYRNRTWLHRARDALRGSAARREFRLAQRLAERGIETVVPLAWGERRLGPLVLDGSFVSRELPGAASLEELAQRAATAPPSPSARRRLAEALGRWLARLHRAGVDHRDLHAGNVLVCAGGAADDMPRVALIDLPDVRLRPSLSWRRRRASLSMLHSSLARCATRADRARFWRAYCDEYGEPRSAQQRRRAVELDIAAWRHSQRILWRRDRRCLGENRDFYCPAGEHRAVHAVRDVAPQHLQRWLVDPWSEMLAARHDVEKLGHAGVVVRSRMIVSGQGIAVACKRSRPQGWWKALVAPLRRGRALEAWRLGHALLARGIATPRPLAALEGSVAGEGFLITRWLEGAENLHLYLWRIAAYPPPIRRRRVRQCAAALGRLVGQMHRWNVADRDLKACNLVVVETPDDVRAALVDLDGVRLRRRLSERTRTRDLARLAASLARHTWVGRADYLRFLVAYAAAQAPARPDWRGIWRSVAPAGRRQVARMLRAGRPVA